MRTSMRTTSGRHSWASRTAPSPSSASPTTSKSSRVPSSAARPRRTTGWSSASSTRIGTPPLWRRRPPVRSGRSSLIRGWSGPSREAMLWGRECAGPDGGAISSPILWRRHVQHHLATARAVTTTKQKVGLALAGLYSLCQHPERLLTDARGEVGPPMRHPGHRQRPGRDRPGGLGAGVARQPRRAARRRRSDHRGHAHRRCRRSSSTCRWSSRPWSGFSVLLTVLAVVLMFSGDRRPAPVSD